MELRLYLLTIRKRFWLIAVIVMFGCIAASIKSSYLTSPVYQANAKLIVNQTIPINGLQVLSSNDIQTNIMLINSYKEIIRSEAIMNKVVEKHPELKTDPKILSANVRVTSASESQVMNLYYQDTSYKRAAKTVNAISQIFKEQIPSIMKVDNVTILNEANEMESAYPININPVLDLTIGFMVSFMLALGLAFLLNYLDNTYKSEIELTEDLGLPVLAVVTDIRKEKRRKTIKQKTGERANATLNQ